MDEQPVEAPAPAEVRKSGLRWLAAALVFAGGGAAGLRFIADSARAVTWSFVGALIVGYLGLWKLVTGRLAPPDHPVHKALFFAGFVLALLGAATLIVRMAP
jgi:hypothetical protein